MTDKGVIPSSQAHSTEMELGFLFPYLPGTLRDSGRCMRGSLPAAVTPPWLLRRLFSSSVLLVPTNQGFITPCDEENRVSAGKKQSKEITKPRVTKPSSGEQSCRDRLALDRDMGVGMRWSLRSLPIQPIL